jgi:hypothetical protein
MVIYESAKKAYQKAHQRAQKTRDKKLGVFLTKDKAYVFTMKEKKNNLDMQKWFDKTEKQLIKTLTAQMKADNENLLFLSDSYKDYGVTCKFFTNTHFLRNTISEWFPTDSENIDFLARHFAHSAIYYFREAFHI